MSNHVGLDIGYSNLKLAMTNASSVEELKRFIHASEDDRANMSCEFNVFSVPAGACRKIDLPETFMGADDIGGQTVLVGDEDWQAGIDFDLSPHIQRDLSPRYKYSPEWRALFHAGLLTTEWDVIDNLVMGLPCKEFYDSPEEVKALEKIAKGDHKVSKDRTVTVKNVIVIPQPIGSFYGYMITDAEGRDSKYLQKAVTLVIDPGYYSFDWVVVKGGKNIIRHSAGSTHFSVREICRQVEEILHNEKKGSRLAEGDIEQCIRNNDLNVFINGEEVYFGNQLATATKDVSRNAFYKVRESMNANNIEPQFVVLTGGGADLFKDNAKEETRADKVLTTQDAVVLNSFGYLYAALQQ